MKTLTIDIQDSFLKEFLNFVQKNQNKILVRNSSDYEDIYFDDRKKQLQKIREDIKDGKEKLYSIDEFEKRFDLFEKEIDKSASVKKEHHHLVIQDYLYIESSCFLKKSADNVQVAEFLIEELLDKSD